MQKRNKTNLTALVFLLIFLSVRPVFAATTVQLVQDYLDAYQNLLIALTEPTPINTVGSSIAVGNKNLLKIPPGISPEEAAKAANNEYMGLLHMLEFIKNLRGNASFQRDFNQCCWNGGRAAQNPEFNNLTTIEVIQKQPSGNYTPSDMMAVQMWQLLNDMTRLYGYTSNNPINPPYNRDRYSLNIMQNIVIGDGEIIDIKYPDEKAGFPNAEIYVDSLLYNLAWAFSYTTPAFHNLNDSFRDYYAFACVVCNGAGFYDTSKLQDTANNDQKYYQLLLTRDNFPQTYDWMRAQEGDITQPTQLAVSIGLTMQGQPNPGPNRDKLDGNATYPGHRHGATELYFALDLYGLLKTNDIPVNEVIQSEKLIWKGPTTTYIANATNESGLVPNFLPDVAPQINGTYPVDEPLTTEDGRTFQAMGNASIAFFPSWSLHAMHPGQRFQFTQWSRFTKPLDGTEFPLQPASKPVPIPPNPSNSPSP